MRFSFKGSPLRDTFSYISCNISAGPSESSALGTNCQKVWLFGLAVSNFSLKNVKHLIILSDILQNFVGGKGAKKLAEQLNIVLIREQSRSKTATGWGDC